MLKATIIGNLAADAETKVYKSGKQYVALTVGHDQGKDKPTVWVKVNWPAGVGHPVLPSLRKGAKVCVYGDLKADAFTDRNGNLQAGIDIYADSVDILLYARREGDQAAPQGTARGSYHRVGTGQQQRPSNGAYQGPGYPAPAYGAQPAPYGAQPGAPYGGYPGHPGRSAEEDMPAF